MHSEFCSKGMICTTVTIKTVFLIFTFLVFGLFPSCWACGQALAQYRISPERLARVRALLKGYEGTQSRAILTAKLTPFLGGGERVLVGRWWGWERWWGGGSSPASSWGPATSLFSRLLNTNQLNLNQLTLTLTALEP